MALNAAAPPVAVDGQQPAPQPTLLQSIGGIVRTLITMWVIRNVLSSINGPKATTTTTDPKTGQVVTVNTIHRNLWSSQYVYDLRVYLSTQGEPFTLHDIDPIKHVLIWQQRNMKYSWDDTISVTPRSLNITIDQDQFLTTLLNNGSVYAHCFMIRQGSVLNPALSGYHSNNIIHKVSRVNTYRAPPKIDKRRNLISGQYTDARFAAQIEQQQQQPEGQQQQQQQVDALSQEETVQNEKQAKTAAAGSSSQATSDSNGDLSSINEFEDITDGDIMDGTKNEINKDNKTVSFWRPQIYLRILYDWTEHGHNQIPPPINKVYDIEPISNNYYPVIYFDYFWLLTERFIPLHNETQATLKSLPIEFWYSPISLLKLQFQLQMEESWKQQEQFGQTENETQEFRRMLMETDPWLLALTAVVSFLHMIFDFLAFKNDIQFWRNKKSTEGLSVRTILLNCGCQLVVFLYLLDNETSWMILLSSGIGLAIEFWKIRRVGTISFDRSLPFPYLSFKSHNQEYEQSQTAQYDDEAMTYLSYVLYPLVICYSIYSLMYDTHKSWYSWILGSLVGTVYTFGFIMMCPQLYLNYKLKSVAHLPWRMLTYKALNTFIDDLFAFIIKMPTLHRLSCFRDDIIFFIYLYQRWIYRVDYKRANEFGLVMVPEEEMKHVKAVRSELINHVDNNTLIINQVTEYLGVDPDTIQQEGAAAAAAATATATTTSSSTTAAVATAIEQPTPSATKNESDIKQRKKARRD